MPDFAAQRLNMVDGQVRANDVTDLRIHRAMLEIPREAFVPPEMRMVAYMEGCVALGAGRVLLDARCFSKLAQLAEIGPEDRVLVVGCGSGYSAAVLARLAAKVIAVEEDSGLARTASEILRGVPNVEVVRGRLLDGFRDGAPYHAILVCGAVETRPETLLDQLAEGGRLVCMLRDNGTSRAHLFVRGEAGISDWTSFDAEVPTLPGFTKPGRFVF